MPRGGRPKGNLMPVMDRRRAVAVPLAMALVLAGGGTHVAGLYMRVETRRVPVDRLVQNLERQLAADPSNPRLHINLARLHGMAWALKTDTVEAAGGLPSGELEPWYGYAPDLIPYRNSVKPGTAEAREEARPHLEKALEHYEAALKLDPDNPLANLGHGWMLQQAGETAGAIERYRRVIEMTWPAEQQKRVGGPDAKFFTYEAAGYLIPLLDQRADAEEIARLREMRKHFDSLPRAVTPLAVPLSADLPPERIHDRGARVRFDADGSGLAREWTWISREAAWLVHDPDARGQIPSALQLFGSVTFWLFWETGYEALGALDDDGDGEIAGPELRGLGLWHDENGDGVSDPGEVRPVALHGIAALSYEYEEGDGLAFAAVAWRGVRMLSGEVRPTYDVLLRSAAQRTTLTESLSAIRHPLPALR